MSTLSMIALDPLRRPPVPGEKAEAFGGALELTACRNESISGLAQIQLEGKAESVSLCFRGPMAAKIRLVAPIPVPEAKGSVSDALIPAESFAVEGSQAVWIGFDIPKGFDPGMYEGTLEVNANGQSAQLPVKLQVADITLPDVKDRSFFLNVWMNPAALAQWHQVPLWSEAHWQKLEPYVADLASHGQKTVVAPIAHKPWGEQTPVPYPNIVGWSRDEAGYHFDYTLFDRYVELHQKYGISEAIHCYSLVQGPGHGRQSQIAYKDASGQEQVITTTVGDADYREAWGAFLKDFVRHLRERGWLEKTYIGFDEKPSDIMETAFSFLREVAPELKISLAANEEQKLYAELDDISLAAHFSREMGISDGVSAERMGSGKLTTYYVCCGPAHPNTFVHSPLVESRMLAWLSCQGGFMGFLRWSYNDWTEQPYEHPEWRIEGWPTGDCFFVYPGKEGPVSSLRWEQLNEGIQDNELLRALRSRIATLPAEKAKAAEASMQEAVALACRNIDGSEKDPEDLRRARSLILKALC